MERAEISLLAWLRPELQCLEWFATFQSRVPVPPGCEPATRFARPEHQASDHIPSIAPAQTWPTRASSPKNDASCRAVCLETLVDSITDRFAAQPDPPDNRDVAWRDVLLYSD